MIIKKTAEYELLINEEKNHGIRYDPNDIEFMLAAMLVSCEVMETKLQQAKEFKKELKGKDKDDMGRQISLISRGLSAVNAIVYPLLNSYEEFKSMKNEG